MLALPERAKGKLCPLRTLLGESVGIGATDVVGERAAVGEAAASGLCLSGVMAPDRAGETAAWR